MPQPKHKYKQESPAQKRKAKAAQRKEWSQEEIDAALIANGGTPKEKHKRPVGRPSEFPKIDLIQAQKLAFAGFTDMQMADFFNVSLRVIYDWKANKPEFLHALKLGKEEADARVERSLYERASGYVMPDEKVFYDSQTGEIKTYQTVKHIAPDPTSMIFWLKNRQRDKWREQPHGESGNPADTTKALHEIAQALQDRDG